MDQLQGEWKNTQEYNEVTLNGNNILLRALIDVINYYSLIFWKELCFYLWIQNNDDN